MAVNESIWKFINYAVNAIDTHFDKMRLDKRIDNHILDRFSPNYVHYLTYSGIGVEQYLRCQGGKLS